MCVCWEDVGDIICRKNGEEWANEKVDNYNREEMHTSHISTT